jgi:hypothetical protein
MKSFKVFLGRIAVSAALVASLLFVTGCAAPKYGFTLPMWHEARVRHSIQPTSEPEVLFFDTADHRDILVQYNEFSPRDGSVRRAYFVNANRARIQVGKKPRFVRPFVANQLASIPVFNADCLSATSVNAATYVVIARDKREFTIYRDGERMETGAFPVYSKRSGIGTRLALTPVAIAADGVLLMLYGMAGGLGP